MDICGELNGKKQVIPFQDGFPFTIGDSCGIDKGSTMLHWHENIEICYLKQGTGMYLIGGRRYAFEKGDIFIINSRDIHLAYNDRDVIMQVAIFDSSLLCTFGGYSFEMQSLRPFWEAGRKKGNKLDANNVNYKDTVQVLMELESEYTRRPDGYRVMIKSLLLKLSAILYRYLDLEDTVSVPDKLGGYNRLQPALNFMESSFDSKVTLDELAASTNMSVSNFCLVFKNTMGISPMEYLARTRIVRASKLLVETDLKIVDVAERCGFFSMSNFIESFRRYTGKVPREFRKNAK